MEKWVGLVTRKHTMCRNKEYERISEYGQMDYRKLKRKVASCSWH